MMIRSVLLVSFFCVASVLLSALPRNSYAQFQGTITPGITHSSNIEGIDTTAPDNILQPAISLEYQTEFSPVALYKFDIGTTPYIYAGSPDHSYTSTTLGVTPQFYLTNIDNIRAEAKELQEEEALENAADEAPQKVAKQTEIKPVADTQSKDTTAQAVQTTAQTTTNSTAATATQTVVPKSGYDPGGEKTDSLVEITTTSLYLVSAALDSIEYKGKNADALGGGRDSASDVISTLADLLDSVDFSVSVKQVALDELSDIRPLLEKSILGLKIHDRVLSDFDRGVASLKLAEPQSDFLPTGDLQPTPSINAPTPTLRTDTTNRKALGKPTAPQPTAKPAKIKAPEAAADDDAGPRAPVYSLITTTSTFRELGSQDFDIAENLEAEAATTYAARVIFPISYEIRSNRTLYAFYDYTALTAEATFESYATKSSVLDLTYDLISTKYQNDSVSTNLENRFRIEFRALLATSTTFFAEAVVGFKTYSNPLTITDSLPKLRKVVNVQTNSSFQQYGLGLGLTQHLGKSGVLGATFNFTTSPNLRSYLDQAPSLRARKQGTGISDDEYTYNLLRFMVFANYRAFSWLDLGSDVAIEHRKYGSLLKKDNAAIIQATGADRIETGLFFNGYLSHTFTYEDSRALSLFNSIILQATISYNGVRAELPAGGILPLFSYKITEFGANVTLGF